MKKRSLSQIFVFHAVYSVSLAVLCLASLVLGRVMWILITKHRMIFADEFRYILAGFLGYFLIHLAIRRKPVLYVLGHELTHVIFVWLFHGWVSRIKIKRTGGVVESTKDNIFISLSPYFFPIYTVFFLILYLAVLGITKERYLIHFMEFLTGLSAGFHFAFLGEMLLTHQDDFQDAGRFFSLLFIVCLNLAVMSLILVTISRKVDAEIFCRLLKDNVFLFTTKAGK